MAEDHHRTIHAQQAFEFSDVFGLKFSIHAFGTSPKRKLKLTEPEVSTDGGRRARQPIVLVAEEEGAGRPLVCGWVDVPRRFAELRSHHLLKQQYEGRAGGSVDISRDEYDRAMGELTAFLAIHRIEASFLDAPPRAPAGPPPMIPPPDRREARPSAPSVRPSAPTSASAEGTPVAAMAAMMAIGVLVGFGLGYLVFGLHVFGASG